MFRGASMAAELEKAAGIVSRSVSVEFVAILRSVVYHRPLVLDIRRYNFMWKPLSCFMLDLRTSTRTWVSGAKAQICAP